MGLRCPQCLEMGSFVTDSRKSKIRPGELRRRRECPSCRTRFTTYEWFDETWENNIDMTAEPLDDRPAVFVNGTGWVDGYIGPRDDA